MATAPSAAAPRRDADIFLKSVGWISTFAGWVSAGMIVAAVAITCQMIWVRFVLNDSTIWQTEAVVYLVIAATLVGLPYVQRLQGHVNVDLIPIMLGRRGRRVLAVAVLAATAIVIAIMVFYAFEWWHLAWERNWRSDTVWGVRLWIPLAAVPAGLALFLLQIVADLWAVLRHGAAPFGLPPKEAR